MSLATLEALARTIRIAAIPAAAAQGAGPRTLCSTCHLRDLCVPSGLSGNDMERLDGLMFTRRRLVAGQTLYAEGERFQYLYAVRTGTFKTTLNSADGREQVSGFQMAGELLGLDGVAHGSYASSAVALEDADVCAIPFARLTELAAANPGLNTVVGRLMSREIVREHRLMLLLGSMTAEERLAAFLLNLAQRLQARGYSPSEFHLRMSRAEIGSYLGLKLETVSRAFSAFQQQRLLEVDKRHITVVDAVGLARVFETRH